MRVNPIPVAFVASVLVFVSLSPGALVAPVPEGVLVLEHHVGSPLDCGDSNGYALLGVRWRHTPVKVYYDPNIPAQFLAAVKAGVEPWEAEEHPAGHLVMEVNNPPKNGVTVKWAYIDGPYNVIAATYTFYRGTNVRSVTLVFDSSEPWAVLPAACGIPLSYGISVQDVSAHEFGHALPTLDHAWGPALTMDPYYNGGLERTLATGDKLGIEARFG